MLAADPKSTPKMVKELFQNEWAVATLEAGGRLVRITRTAHPFSEGALGLLRTTATALFSLAERREKMLLLDTRLAPLLGNDSLEQALARSTADLVGGYQRSAVLVATAVGRLQAQRFSQVRQGESAIFHDEAEALRYLFPVG
jgi:hypothetical protein